MITDRFGQTRVLSICLDMTRRNQGYSLATDGQ